LRIAHRDRRAGAVKQHEQVCTCPSPTGRRRATPANQQRRAHTDRARVRDRRE
jgi:hypothetical protein